jgi:hypothetical protein
MRKKINLRTFRKMHTVYFLLPSERQRLNLNFSVHLCMDFFFSKKSVIAILISIHTFTIIIFFYNCFIIIYLLGLATRCRRSPDQPEGLKKFGFKISKCDSHCSCPLFSRTLLKLLGRNERTVLLPAN